MIIATGGEDDFAKDPLESALRALARVDIETHTVAIAMLRFGWTRARIASFQGIPPREVAARWKFARAFLRRELASGETT